MEAVGAVIWISGPVVRARTQGVVHMLEQAYVGDDRLIGEVIGIDGDIVTLQVYEDTSGLRPGAAIYGVGMPLGVELGPGLVGKVFDGIQRPLETLAALSGDFIQRGITVPALDRDARWRFSPTCQPGTDLKAGATLGTVQETPLVQHCVMAPVDMAGHLTWVAPEGEYRVTDVIARVDSDSGQERSLTMMQRWAVREPRPVQSRLAPSVPLITGQRVIDTFFPIAKGGAAAVPGGFGAGKTVLQQALAKWSDAGIIIYIGCGERGNEMTDVLNEFPRLQDPATGRPLMERTILIANTSNMPVAAREASIYTGITLAEYYRDMGYDVALMADSTSRWAEALREISGRLEEMPAEEGFPAYLASRLASFYERAGRVLTCNGQEGSVTVVGAVSPPSGDFSEPVTQHTQRYIRAFWALDKTLAAARHFPSVNWLESYSGYMGDVATWWTEQVSSEWLELRGRAMTLLQQEAQLEEIVRLVGPDSLPDQQRFVLLVARMVKEAFLQQNAMDAIDAFTTPQKQVALLKLLVHLHERGSQVIERGAPVSRLQNEVRIWPQLARARSTIPNNDLDALVRLQSDLDEQLAQIERDYADEQDKG